MTENHSSNHGHGHATHSTHQAEKPADLMKHLKKLDFKAMLNDIMALIAMNPVLIFGMAVAPVLVSAILDTYLFPGIYAGSAMTGGALIIPVIILQIAIGYALWFAGVGLVYQTLHQVEKKSADPAKIANFVKDNFVKGLSLVWEILLYTKGWMVLAYLIVASVLVGTIGAGQVALAGVGGVLLLFAPLVYLVYLFVFFKPLVSSSFALMFFFNTEKPEVKGALNESVKTVGERTWSTFGALLLGGFAIGIASGLINMILSPIFAPIGWGAGSVGYGSAIIPAIVNGAASAVMAVYTLVLSRHMKKL